MTRFRRSALLAAATLACGTAQARETDGWPSSMLDRPVKVQTIKAGPGADPLPEIVCTSYADLMVRESGTDTPSPDKALLIRLAGPAKHPACSRTAPAGAVALSTSDFSFVGRKGPYLFFRATDPNGAVPFLIVDAGTGRMLVRDSTKEGRVQSLARENGTLQLRFTRGINGSCSLLQDATACWAKMAQHGLIPEAVAKLPPPAEACAASYGKSKTGPDDPSLIFYDADLTLTGAGPAAVLSNGPLGCEPMP